MKPLDKKSTINLIYFFIKALIVARITTGLTIYKNLFEVRAWFDIHYWETPLVFALIMTLAMLMQMRKTD